MTHVVLLSQVPSLIDQCSAIADGVGIDLTVRAPGSGGWQDAVLVLLGEDVTSPPLMTGTPTLLVAMAQDSRVWESAARLGVDHVAVLPHAAEWLTHRLISAVEPPAEPAVTCGFVAGCGGAGASVLAAAVAVRASSEVSTVLVDADPLGGGVDLVLGCEDAPGVRWPSLAASHGRLRPSTLLEALPRHGELSVLSWDREDHVDLDAGVFDTVLAAAQQAFDLVVVDLPRHAPTGWVRSCHHVAVVTPGRVRAAIATAHVVSRLAAVHSRLGLVVREPGRGGLDPGIVAETIGLELWGTLKDDARLTGRVDRGEGLPGGRAHVTRFADSFLERVGR